MMTKTADTTATETATITAPKVPKAQQTATITLTAHDSIMQIVAERKADESARTFVITTDASKKSARGMTEHHTTFEAAKAATERMAKAATKMGWHRREARRGFVAKPDAFSSLPVAPKGKQ